MQEWRARALALHHRWVSLSRDTRRSAASFGCWLLDVAVVATLTGTAVAAFLAGLARATSIAHRHPLVVIALPLALVATRWAGRKWPIPRLGDVLGRTSTTRPTVGLHVTLATWAAHLLGAPVGREGAALHVAASIAGGWAGSPARRARRHKLAIAAGFSAAFGTPLAGTALALELVARSRRTNNTASRATNNVALWLATGTAALVADRVARAWGTHHGLFTKPSTTPRLRDLLAALALGLAIAALARGVLELTALVRRVTTPPLLGLLGAASLALALWVAGTDYYGLSLGFTNNSTGAGGALLKLVLTCVAIGLGFVGGEATPLVMSGAAFARWLFTHLAAESHWGAIVGGPALYCVVVGAPLTGLALIYEWGSWQALILGLPTMAVAHLLAGSYRAYSAPPFAHQADAPTISR